MAAATTKKPSKCTGAIRKQLVRNITVAPAAAANVNRPRAYRHCHFQLPAPNTADDADDNDPVPPVPSAAGGGHRTKYQSPKLQSTLAIARQIESIKLAPIPTDDLTARSKAFANEQVNNNNWIAAS